MRTSRQLLVIKPQNKHTPMLLTHDKDKSLIVYRKLEEMLFRLDLMETKWYIEVMIIISNGINYMGWTKMCSSWGQNKKPGKIRSKQERKRIHNYMFPRGDSAHQTWMTIILFPMVMHYPVAWSLHRYMFAGWSVSNKCYLLSLAICSSHKALESLGSRTRLLSLLGCSLAFKHLHKRKT